MSFKLFFFLSLLLHTDTAYIIYLLTGARYDCGMCSIDEKYWQNVGKFLLKIENSFHLFEKNTVDDKKKVFKMSINEIHYY